MAKEEATVQLFEDEEDKVGSQVVTEPTEPEEEKEKNGKKAYVTKHGYPLDEAKSALQKAIRRGDEEGAMFWAYEMVVSGFAWQCWQRLKVIAMEDCSGMLPIVFVAQASYIGLKMKGYVAAFYAARTALELARCPHERTTDDFLWLLTEKMKEPGWTPPEVPDEAVDIHTKRGRKMGRSGERGTAFFAHVGTKLENEAPTYRKQYIEELRRRHPLHPEDGGEG